MKTFEVYSMPHCPHCVRAKDLLTRKGYSFKEFVIGENGVSKDTIQNRVNKVVSGVTVRTVPQIILIEGDTETYIGGADDLFSKIDSL